MISVVIPSYKNLALCQQAVASVLKQKGCEFELVITDDTPSNEIKDWIKSLGSNKIRYYHNQPSKGAIDNWNYGLSLAQGEGIILLHHDESFANEDYLNKVEDLLSHYDVIISNKKVLMSYGEKQERFPKWIKKPFIFLKYSLFIINVVGPCACFAFRKDCLQEFDNRMHWKVDIDWYFRLLQNAKRIHYVDSKEIVSHHGHEDQITENIDITKTSTADTLIIKEKYKSVLINCCMMLGRQLSKLK